MFPAGRNARLYGTPFGTLTDWEFFANLVYPYASAVLPFLSGLSYYLFYLPSIIVLGGPFIAFNAAMTCLFDMISPLNVLATLLLF